MPTSRIASSPVAGSITRPRAITMSYSWAVASPTHARTRAIHRLSRIPFDYLPAAENGAVSLSRAQSPESRWRRCAAFTHAAAKAVPEMRERLERIGGKLRPFLLFDHTGLKPGQSTAFPDHPHRGFRPCAPCRAGLWPAPELWTLF